MHITYINNSTRAGGAGTVAWQLHRGMQRLKHNSRIYVAEETALRFDARALYPRRYTALYDTRLQRWTQACFPRFPVTDAAFRQLAQARVDLVHIHNFHGNYASIESLTMMTQQRPTVWTFHRFWGITGGCDFPFPCERFLHHCGQCPRVNEWPVNGTDNTTEQWTLKMRLLQNAALDIVAPSRFLERTVRSSPIGQRWNVHHIPNGVDLNQFSGERKHQPEFRRRIGVPPGALTVLLLCRNFADPVKGYACIRTALACSGNTAKSHSLFFLLVGNSTALPRRDIGERWPYRDFGYVSSSKKLAEIYELADIFLFASPGENFPCVILEAMASRCCIVTTPTTGVLEQVEHGLSALVAESIAGASLAKQLHRAIEDQSLRNRCGRAARDVVERHFGEQQMVERHLKLYHEILQRRLPVSA